MNISELKNCRLSPQEAANEFETWVALFAGEIFVKIVAYVDESGTHDKAGIAKGSGFGVVAGLADEPEAWTDFCKDWQSVLNKYSAPYFHFYEFADASRVIRKLKAPGRRFSQNPYGSWKLDKLDGFLLELAKLVGSGNKVLVGTYVNVAKMHKAQSVTKTTGLVVPVGDVPYEHLLAGFFQRLPADILSGRPDWIGTLAVFFDWNTNQEWQNCVTKCFQTWKQQDRRFRELTFADKKYPPHLPLQAADMVAYRYRQLAENHANNRLKLDPIPRLDDLINQSLFSQFRRHGQ